MNRTFSAAVRRKYAARPISRNWAGRCSLIPMRTHAPFFVLVPCSLLSRLLLISACDIGEIPSGGDSAASASRRSGSEGSGSGGSGSGGSGSAHGLAYVPRPLQPNNCGTPDTFKACRVASNGPRKPVVVIEERDDRGGEPISASNGPRKPVVVIEELDSRGGEPVNATSDPLSAYSRSMLEPVLLPSLRREDELQKAIQDTMQRRVETLQQQEKRLEQQLSERSQELQHRGQELGQELEQKTSELRAVTQTEKETLRQVPGSVRRQP
jgi:hypothetical protein